MVGMSDRAERCERILDLLIKEGFNQEESDRPVVCEWDDDIDMFNPMTTTLEILEMRFEVDPGVEIGARVPVKVEVVRDASGD